MAIISYSNGAKQKLYYCPFNNTGKQMRIYFLKKKKSFIQFFKSTICSVAILFVGYNITLKYTTISTCHRDLNKTVLRFLSQSHRAINPTLRKRSRVNRLIPNTDAIATRTLSCKYTSLLLTCIRLLRPTIGL